MPSGTTGHGQANAQLAPTKEAERSEIVDVVRGFALLGVVVMNWHAAGDLLTFDERQSMPTAEFDRVVQMLDMLLFQNKFYTIFSMLFGLGFALQLGRATSRGRNLIPTYLRRLAILFIIGVGHGILLYYGDILHAYALLGVVLILFHKRSDRFILGSAIAIALFLLFALVLEPFLPPGWTGDISIGGHELSRAERLGMVLTGGWSGVIRFNATMLIVDYGSVWEGVTWYLDIFWKFLFGFWVGRHGLLRNADEYVRMYRRVLPWALLIGLTGNALKVGVLFRLIELPARLLEPEFPGPLISIAYELAIPALALAYICMLVLNYQRPKGRRVLAVFAPLGRMALTNYLLQSVVLAFLFFGVGLGLAGRVGIGITTLLAISTFLIQIPLSALWLRRFRFGPAEWAWRCLTYGRRMPIR